MNDYAGHSRPQLEIQMTNSPNSPEAASDMVEIGFLQRRQIEANIISPIYRAMCQELGAQRAGEIIGDAIAQDARKSGAEFAAKERAGADLTTFVEIQSLWRRGGALETETLEQTENAFRFNVTRCKYSEMYRELGLAEIGKLLSCVRDAEFIAGYNPNIEFRRTQTLMEGASHCDFEYRLTPTEENS